MLFGAPPDILNSSFPFCSATSLDNLNPNDLNWFINQLKIEESKLSSSTGNFKVLLSKIRKIFYNTGGWDAIIPAAAGIKNENYITIEYPYAGFPKQWPNPDFNAAVKRLKDFPGKANFVPPASFSFTDMGSKPLDVNQQSPSIFCGGDPCQKYLNQEVKFGVWGCGSGEVMIDMGHVLTGLDALYHEETFWPPLGPVKLPVFTNSSNVGVATWVGDLGSVLAEFVYLSHKKSAESGGLTTTPTLIEIQQAIDKLASGADMIGNIDAYGIYGIQVPQDNLVSSWVENYYNIQIAVSPTKRFRFFAERIGLIWDGSGFSNLESLLPRYIDDVMNFAIVYVIVSAKNAGGLVEIYNAIQFAIPKLEAQEHTTELFLRAFFRDLADKCK